MADPVVRRATYDDVLAAPENMVAEIIDGELHLNPRPLPRHTRAASAMGAFLLGAFDSGIGGPGGWIVLDEPELHLGSDVIVPDLAAYREERYPGDADEEDRFWTVAPDWVCEILSKRTARTDRTKKIPLYARERVPHVWIVDPRDRTIEVFRLEGAGYVLAKTSGGDDEPFTLEPFDAVPIPPAAFWGRRLPK